ncbi:MULTISPECIES: hypothetical protein [unclassified Nostoc]|uniref:hypothetical protein n=1 Tax=unclassified Nostoc TaxID=2593658 RepID=UPI002AD38094|nr:hypothetical protein [Nostoc sp. DedQUE03]MDZ7973877.1 hypothetical protein [Nostoc sp. DedQUE03]MDZ8047492.1 hypothetical protein [Nostoc sp. DedQUE02]
MRIWSYEALPSWKIIVWVTQLFSHATAITFGLRVLVSTKRQYYLLSLRYNPIFNTKRKLQDKTWFCDLLPLLSLP